MAELKASNDRMTASNDRLYALGETLLATEKRLTRYLIGFLVTLVVVGLALVAIGGVGLKNILDFKDILNDGNGAIQSIKSSLIILEPILKLLLVAANQFLAAFPFFRDTLDSILANTNLILPCICH